MRRILIALGTMIALAGCVETTPTMVRAPMPMIVAPVIVEPSATPTTVPQYEPQIAADPAETSTEAVIAGPVAALPPPDTPMLVQQRAACEREGGNMMPRGAGVFACVHPTGDGGRLCDAASDCEGLCLARSGTCAPMAPLYGCQEVYTTQGQRERLCTE